jgi:hypothetical protein
VDYGSSSPGSTQLEISTDNSTWDPYSESAQLNAEGKLWVRTPIIDDTDLEPDETFELIVTDITEAEANLVVFDVDFQTINLDGLTLTEGSANTAGAVYTQIDAITIGG